MATTVTQPIQIQTPAYVSLGLYTKKYMLALLKPNHLLTTRVKYDQDDSVKWAFFFSYQRCILKPYFAMIQMKKPAKTTSKAPCLVVSI